MVVIGDEHLRVVVYPIEPGVNNRLLVRPADDASDEFGNWSRAVEPRAIAQCVHAGTFDWPDVPALLGDAAHAMYPFGSNGASQATILDAGAQADLKEVGARYKRLAGFDAETLSSKCGFATLLDPHGGLGGRCPRNPGTVTKSSSPQAAPAADRAKPPS